MALCCSLWRRHIRMKKIALSCVLYNYLHAINVRLCVSSRGSFHLAFIVARQFDKECKNFTTNNNNYRRHLSVRRLRSGNVNRGLILV